MVVVLEIMQQARCTLARSPPGTVAFGSGLHQWAFTLSTFAKIYGKKFGIEHDKMMKRLWGDNFFGKNKEGKNVWTTSANLDGKTVRRAFCQFIMDPICQLCQGIWRRRTMWCRRC